MPAVPAPYKVSVSSVLLAFTLTSRRRVHDGRITIGTAFLQLPKPLTWDLVNSRFARFKCNRARDAAGNLYITDSGTDSVYEVTPGGVQTTLISGLNVPDGVAIDGSGNLYIANTYNKQVVKIDRADAPSLKFDSTQVGSTSADSPKAVQVENIGNVALQFSALTYPADFPQGRATRKTTQCTASTSLAAAGTCVLTIDFSPVKPLGSKTSALLREDINLVTNNNVAGALEQVAVTGTETKP
jgi:hypothetical protein